MTLVARIELLHGSYDAAGNDAWAAEWPPHPARLFCALLGGGPDDEDLRALRWLESQMPPRLLADASLLGETRRHSFVVTNRVEPTGGHQTHIGRKAIERLRSSSVPRTPSWAFEWSEAEPRPEDFGRLQRLARQIPYLGRSPATAVVTFEPDAVTWRDQWVSWEPLPAAASMDAEEFLRVPYPGYTDALVGLHESGGRAWEAGRSRAYRLSASMTGAPDEVTLAPHSELVVLGLPVGISVPGEHAGILAAALRKTVMSRARDPLTATLTGHDADGQTHVGFLALLDTGHPHARGHALGVAIAVPRDDAAAGLAVAEALARSANPIDVVLPSGIRVVLDELDHRRQTRQLLPATWMRPSRTWATVTPIVLDRFPKHRGEAAEVARICSSIGLPDPVDIVISPSPLVLGAPRLLRRHLPRRDKRPLVHARITFAAPVSGPLLLGAQRYLGMGLCRPYADRGQQP